MKILWVNTNFLHPTTKGGRIRTLEMLRELHRRHEVHYAAFVDQKEPEGPQRAGEYSTKSYALPLEIADKASTAFAVQLAKGLFSPMPVAVSRFHSRAMQSLLEELRQRETFDHVICDFLASAPNFGSDLRGAVLFQHNIETILWRRRVEQAKEPLRRAYLGLQARRMFGYERAMCRQARGVITVSEEDAAVVRREFGVTRTAAVATGVDVEHFRPRDSSDPSVDITFVGSMDWMPNVDGMTYFIKEVLPAIRQKRPECTVAIVGRSPDKQILELVRGVKGITVTGTVPDVRPWLWKSRIAIVPLRIGGGTRLKIYEGIAAGVPTVSTTVGAEGLPLENGKHILIGDSSREFAGACLKLLESAELRNTIAAQASEFVAGRFSWRKVTEDFEGLLETIDDRAHEQVLR